MLAGHVVESARASDQLLWNLRKASGRQIDFLLGVEKGAESLSTLARLLLLPLRPKPIYSWDLVAGTTGLEPATSAVTANRKLVTC